MYEHMSAVVPYIHVQCTVVHTIVSEGVSVSALEVALTLLSALCSALTLTVVE